MRAERREETATALGEQLRAADAVIDVPDGLWERVREPRPDVTPAAPGTARTSKDPAWRRRPLPMTVIVVAAAAVVFVVCGTWWLVSPSGGTGAVQGGAAQKPSSGGRGGPDGQGDPDSGPITLRVHNVEKACQKLRTLECALRVAKSPYELYADPGNSAGRVWHGDSLTAACVITDGQLVTDEKGVSSRRWYRVEKSGGSGDSKRVEGWLPGVRTRNSTEVRLCSGNEKPPGHGS
ncbi:hypothetical protein HCC61_16135 [Streptomyces sp. HNM0575]|uniref:hypothetical protein n=1 Tax=Streptomyces sp. HNM0575 TaxID=2716338 RepID=UPI00145E4505|nr:hypothetical protein [Streptomyces sp. HNM0575]NLU74191.1 hypothetical protein [Streptomyces sp. HNM0575]